MSSQPWWAQFRRDGSERERFLAISCAVLGTGCVGIAYLAPRLLGPRLNITRVLLFAYLAYSLVSLLTTTVYRTSSSAWRWCMHATGVASICLLTMSTGGAHSPFLLLYVLALLTAAELWGMRGTLITSFACAALLLLPPLAFSWTGRILPLYEAGSSMKGALTLSGSLIMASYLLGFLAEEAKRRHVNALIISRLIGNGLPTNDRARMPSNTKGAFSALSIRIVNGVRIVFILESTPPRNVFRCVIARVKHMASAVCLRPNCLQNIFARDNPV